MPSSFTGRIGSHPPPRTMMLLGATLLPLWTASVATPPPPPAVYWTSNPTLPNETLVVAGAFAEDRQARLCTTRDCSSGSVVPTPPLTGTWTHSVKVILPAAGCGPPCYLHVDGGGGGSMTAAAPAAAGATTSVVEVNAPDLWWALSGSPASGGTQSRGTLSNLPLRVVVQQGDTLRLFGRSLAWSADHTRCVSAADPPGPVATTSLQLTPTDSSSPVPSLWATCYEATFNTAGMSVGHHPKAALTTRWGTSQPLDLTIVAAPPPAPPHQVVVNPGGGGGSSSAQALATAMENAAQYVATHAGALVEVQLGRHTYKLSESLIMPERTTLVGAGPGLTTLEFDLMPPPPPPAPPPRCSKPILADFYTVDCKNRGCHTRECPGCFLEVGVTHSAGSPDGCCAACGSNPRCNAYTFVGSVDLPGGYCSLNYCPDEPKGAGKSSSCASTPSSPGLGNRTSGWVLNRTKVPSDPVRISIKTIAAAAIYNDIWRLSHWFLPHGIMCLTWRR
jgi:hypothetical protein